MEDTPFDPRAVATAARCSRPRTRPRRVHGRRHQHRVRHPGFPQPGRALVALRPAGAHLPEVLRERRDTPSVLGDGRSLYPALKAARPNRAHLALAAIERRGGLRRIITQNIDGLHQRAGTSRDKVIEIHGTALAVACLSCGARSDRAPVQARFAAGDVDPHCDCGGLLKPATISFGQSMPERETAQAFEDAAAADAFLVIGSSLVVYPAASLPGVALEHGAPLVIVNREPTPYDDQATVRCTAAPATPSRRSRRRSASRLPNSFLFRLQRTAALPRLVVVRRVPAPPRWDRPPAGIVTAVNPA